MTTTIQLLGLQDAMEKKAGKWNNIIWENLGSLLSMGTGAAAGYGIASALGADELPILLATAGGGLLPNLIGYGTGILGERRNPEEQQEVDDSEGEMLADLLIPGYAAWNHGKRTRAKIEGDKEDLNNNVLSEDIGGAITSLIPYGGIPNAIGSIAGLLAPTRSPKDQAEADKDSTQTWLNLIPGVAGFQAARRMKADYK